MILVDTSIWVEHLKRENDVLVGLLKAQRILGHPYVAGELALGGTDRTFLYTLGKLRQAIVARPDEVLGFIQSGHVFGRGIGYVDVHLLASARLMGDAEVWTRDKRLRRVAEEMGIAAKLLG